MALATKCPHCLTTFRVAHDQLKLRAGLVRCGACKEVFNGIEHLLRPDEPGAPGARAQAAPAAASIAAPVAAPLLPDPPQPSPLDPAADPAPDPAPAITAATDQPPEPVAAIAAESDATATTEPPPPATAAPEPPDPAASDAGATETGYKVDLLASIESAALASSLDFDIAPADERWPLPTTNATPASVEIDPGDPLQRMTLMDFSDLPEDLPGADTASIAAKAGADGPDPLDEAIDDLRRKPWRGEGHAVADADDPDASAADVPGFVKRGQRQQRVGRTVRLAMLSGSLILLLVLLGQGAYIFRNVLGATFPPLKPVLVTACDLLGCTVGLPAQIEAVSIESSELQALPPAKDSFMLSMLLRNRSATVQAWPNIELTLNDANDKPIGRRVFMPRDYLAASTDPSRGLASMSEQSIKITLELAQLKASGFKVYLFYP